MYPWRIACGSQGSAQSADISPRTQRGDVDKRLFEVIFSKTTMAVGTV
jgi:hypothetical protein